MELGKYLVRELDFEDGVDTLGRWMAHHLSELIHEAENGKSEEKRLKANQQTTETILKIWEHRKNLPRETYPLAKYEDLLKVIDRLRISSNPYRFESYNLQNRTDQIASMLFDTFTRLILTLLLMKTESIKSQKKVDDVAVEALDEEEKQIWSAIHDWMTIFPTELNQDKPARKKKEKQTFDLNRNSIILIDSLNDLLKELKNEVQK